MSVEVDKTRIERLRSSWNPALKVESFAIIHDLPEKPNKTKRKVRLPNNVLDLLRFLNMLYETKRGIPELVSACLRATRGKTCLKLHSTPRNDSEKVDIMLDDEFANLEHAEIVARIAHALIGIQAKLPKQVA